jgi:hypothetical protein
MTTKQPELTEQEKQFCSKFKINLNYPVCLMKNPEPIDIAIAMDLGEKMPDMPIIITRRKIYEPDIITA